mmetsp:Transcript_101816/g.227506  ORF Transcript_101816/g.227506 Transcript_101816/m.227506 type:complete len:81 (-) Transcript_101816:3395-3637(-)
MRDAKGDRPCRAGGEFIGERRLGTVAAPARICRKQTVPVVVTTALCRLRAFVSIGGAVWHTRGSAPSTLRHSTRLETIPV